MGKGRKGKRPQWRGPKKVAPKPPAKKQGVLVCVPAGDGTVTVAIAHFMLVLSELSRVPEYPYRFGFFMPTEVRPVEYARNVCVGEFLKTEGMDRLWFIDADMLPDREAARVLDTDADIVSGRAFAFSEKDGVPNLKLCCFRRNESGEANFVTVAHPEDDPEKVELDGCGTANLVISRKVLEDRRMWLESKGEGLDGAEHDCLEKTDPWAPPVFRTIYAANGHRLRGEDIDFAWRAKQLGYSVAGNYAARTGHRKEVDLNKVEALCQAVQARTLKMVQDGKIVVPEDGPPVRATG